MAGGNLPFGLAPSGSLTSYTPTLRERATDWVRKSLFSDDRAGQGRAEKVMDVAAVTPFGFGLDVYDAGREAGMGNYGTAATMLGMAAAPGPSPKGIRAYHGSPHDFDRFDMSKIGTGEGAQAYGHGLYFADTEGTAKYYRDQLSKQAFDVKKIADPYLALSDEDAVRKIGYAIKQAELNGQKGIAADYRAAQDWFKAGRPDQFSAGRMYEVNINADPDSFLDWDKPLSEQPEAVRKHFAHLKDKSLTGEDLARRMESRVWIDEAAQAGIPGLKYLDAGSRGAGDGTRNYVVFDDRLIEVVRKYGIAGASAMLGYNLLDGMDPAQAEELKRIEGNQ